MLTMEDAGPICLACADLDHLEFLPSGDAALTRRAKKASLLSAVVLRWSRARNRYERQGLLVEIEAVEQAEAECLADADVRQRRQQREAARREVIDEHFVTKLAAAIRAQFPGCPERRADAIARHAGVRGSGRIGRTQAGQQLDPDAVRLAVVASVRHEDTDYDLHLAGGMSRFEARAVVADEVEQVLDRWRHAW
jgi:hypothetical protein